MVLQLQIPTHRPYIIVVICLIYSGTSMALGTIDFDKVYSYRLNMVDNAC